MSVCRKEQDEMSVKMKLFMLQLSDYYFCTFYGNLKKTNFYNNTRIHEKKQLICYLDFLSELAISFVCR